MLKTMMKKVIKETNEHYNALMAGKTDVTDDEMETLNRALGEASLSDVMKRAQIDPTEVQVWARRHPSPEPAALCAYMRLLDARTTPRLAARRRWARCSAQASLARCVCARGHAARRCKCGALSPPLISCDLA